MFPYPNYPLSYSNHLYSDNLPICKKSLHIGLHSLQYLKSKSLQKLLPIGSLSSMLPVTSAQLDINWLTHWPRRAVLTSKHRSLPFSSPHPLFFPSLKIKFYPTNNSTRMPQEKTGQHLCQIIKYSCNILAFSAPRTVFLSCHVPFTTYAKIF